jgi:hypothetical protein
MRVLHAPPAKARNLKGFGSAFDICSDVGDNAHLSVPSGEKIAEGKWPWSFSGSHSNGFQAFPVPKPLELSAEDGRTQTVPPPRASVEVSGLGGGGGGGDTGSDSCSRRSGIGGGLTQIDLGNNLRGGMSGESNGSGRAAWQSINVRGYGDSQPPFWLPSPSAPSAIANQISSATPWSNGPDVAAAGEVMGDSMSCMRSGSKTHEVPQLIMPTQEYGLQRGSALAMAAAAETAASKAVAAVHPMQKSPRVASTGPPAQAGWRMHI